jgi:hypothetical protein
MLLTFIYIVLALVMQAPKALHFIAQQLIQPHSTVVIHPLSSR